MNALLRCANEPSEQICGVKQCNQRHLLASSKSSFACLLHAEMSTLKQLGVRAARNKPRFGSGRNKLLANKRAASCILAKLAGKPTCDA